MIEGKDFSFLEGVGQRRTAAEHRCLVPPTRGHSAKRCQQLSTQSRSTRYRAVPYSCTVHVLQL